MRRAPLLIVIGAAVALLFIAHSPSWLELSRIAGIHAILAVSVGISYGQAGILSLCQAGLASVGAYATAIVTAQHGYSPILGLVLAIALPAGLSYLLAIVLVRLSPLALALATVLFGELVHFALTRGGDLTGGFIGIGGIPTPWPLDSRVGAHLVVWIAVALAVLLAANLQRSPEGAAARAIATDKVLARSLGVPVRVRLSAIFALSGAIAGLAGFLYAHTSRYLSPESLGIEMSIAVAAMAIIGGRFAPAGPVVGALIVVLMLDLLPADEYAGLFYGGLLIVAVLLFPRGVVGWLGELSSRRAGSTSAEAPAVAATSGGPS